MTQQTNRRVFKVGSAKSYIDRNTSEGGGAGKRPWAFCMALMMLFPMASFEQVGRGRHAERNVVAIHSTSLAKPRTDACCEPSSEPKEATSTYRIGIPTRKAFQRADLEMMRNYAAGNEILLPTMSSIQFEAADMEMEVSFLLSNASWTSNQEKGDDEINECFQLENLPGPTALQNELADSEIQKWFQMYSDPA